MYAIYKVVVSNSQKQALKEIFKQLKRADKNFYSGYVEVAPKFDEARSNRRAMMSLEKAVKKGKVDTVVLDSFENLYMNTRYAYNILCRWMDMGVSIALEEPNAIQTEDAIYQKLLNIQKEYLVKNLVIPIITYEKCYVKHFSDSIFIYFEKDFLKRETTAFGYEEACFTEVVEVKEKTLYIYRSDVNGWYRIEQTLLSNLLKSL